jgi:hypothetical protein
MDNYNQGEETDNWETAKTAPDALEINNPSEAIAPARVAAAIAAGLAVLTAIAWCTGMLVVQVRWPGLLALWGGGFLAGVVGKKAMGNRTSKLVGFVLAGGCVLALVFAETYYIRSEIVQGQDDWLISLSLVPQFLQQNPTSTIVAIVSTTFGASAAYRESARQFRYVRVETR